MITHKYISSDFGFLPSVGTVNRSNSAALLIGAINMSILSLGAITMGVLGAIKISSKRRPKTMSWHDVVQNDYEALGSHLSFFYSYVMIKASPLEPVYERTDSQEIRDDVASSENNIAAGDADAKSEGSASNSKPRNLNGWEITLLWAG